MTIAQLYEDVCDKETRADYGIAKISRQLFLEIVKELQTKNGGKQLDDIEEEDVYELALEKKRELYREQRD